jgi:CheY-like chemotaxis protein
MKPHFTALVVDDDGFSRRTATRILSRLGASSVLEAGDGDEALACVNALEAPVDVLLCDLKMPKVDGIETIQALTGRKRPGLIILQRVGPASLPSGRSASR